MTAPPLASPASPTIAFVLKGYPRLSEALHRGYSKAGFPGAVRAWVAGSDVAHSASALPLAIRSNVGLPLTMPIPWPICAP